MRVPGPGVEDRRQLPRDRWDLSRELNRQINRTQGLLATQGISPPVNGDLPAQLERARYWDDSPIWSGLALHLLPEYERMQLAEQQVKAIEHEPRQTLRTSQYPGITVVRELMRLKSIHLYTAWPLLMELIFPGGFQNGREIGAIVDPGPVPYQSGDMSRERGLSKCGNACLRSLAVEFASQWLFRQRDSEVTIVPALRGSPWYE